MKKDRRIIGDWYHGCKSVSRRQSSTTNATETEELKEVHENLSSRKIFTSLSLCLVQNRNIIYLVE